MEINDLLAKGIDKTDETAKVLGKRIAERRRDRRESDFKWRSCARELNIMNAFLKVLQGRKIKTKNANTARILHYAEELAPCYEAWLSWRGKRPALEHAEQVLRMYYQKDRILDYLVKVEDFANSIKPTDDPEILMLKGYNNYIFFLGTFMKRLKEDQESLARQESDRAESNTDAIYSFLTEECRDIGLISMIPGILNKLEPYQEKYLVEDSVEAEDYDAIRKILMECAEWKNSLDQRSGEEAKKNTKRLAESLRERISRCLRTIEESEKLYEALTALLTTEWLKQFDPDAEDSPLENRSALEIQEFYRNSMKEIEEKLLQVYVRKQG